MVLTSRFLRHLWRVCVLLIAGGTVVGAGEFLSTNHLANFDVRRGAPRGLAPLAPEQVSAQERIHAAVPDLQPIEWDDGLCGQFSVDGTTGVVTSGKVAGNVLTLQLKTPGGRTLTYLDSKNWSQKTLLRGTNGLAALTFCAVPITP